jgi:hypothetical protein
VIVSEERRLAARLRVQFSDSTIVLAGEAMPEAARDEPRVVVASDDRLPELLQSLGLADREAEARRIELPYRYGADRPLRARYAWVLLAPSRRAPGASR